MSLATLSDEQIAAALKEHGSLNAVASSLGIARSSLQNRVKRSGLLDSSHTPSSPRQRAPKPTVTRESLHAALLPPNNCKVKEFLEALDNESRTVIEEALGYDRSDFSAGALRAWLIGLGFNEKDVPGVDAITNHRAGRRPCRCLG